MIGRVGILQNAGGLDREGRAISRCIRQARRRDRHFAGETLRFFMRGDMTAKANTPVTEKRQERNPLEPDWYLQSLVSMVNGNNGEFPVTLYMRGVVISGHLVSGHKYFAGLRAQLTEFFGNSESPKTADIITYLTEPGEGFLDESNRYKDFPQYIHMRAAKIVTPGQKPLPSEGVWWRGRLADVDGFNFGLMVVNE
jgi:hypothetical protein